MSLRTSTKLHSRVVFILATVSVLGTARAAPSKEDDPFAGDQPSAKTPAPAPGTSTASPSVEGGQPGPQKQGPIASPEEPAEVPPAVVQQLPASAYPEPVIRGLYGGPLWLDMQGLQWPYTSRTGIGLSGYGWIDNMYRLIRLGGNQPSDHTTKLFQQGRFLLRVTPTYTNGSWFVQAQSEVVANKDQYVADANSNNFIGADDVWVRTGTWQEWDLTVGRFQAFDVYPLGMGLDLNSDERLGAFDATNPTAQSLYAVDFLLYRPPGPGNIALHLYPMTFLRFELLGQYGNTGGENEVGGRPAVIFDVGWLKIRGALEYKYLFAQDPSPGAKDTEKYRGGGGSVQLVVAPWVEFGVNGGYNVSDVANPLKNLEKSGNQYSFGGFIDTTPIPSNRSLMIGAGGNYTSFHDLNMNASTGDYDRSTNLQAYVAVQYLFYKQLFVKVVGSYAKSHFANELSPMPYDDDMLAVRVRLMYLY
jgi:hypothetical protein